MHPNGSADILFRGIPRNANHRSARFLTSLCIHLTGLGLVLAIVPEMVIPDRTIRFTTPLIAPIPPAPTPPPPAEPARPVVAVHKTPPPPRPVLRPVPRVPVVMPKPKLEEAPRLPNTPVAAVLPAPAVEIRPAIQTGLFGSSAPAQEKPKLPVPASQDAGFDRTPANSPAAQPATLASAGFDSRPAAAPPTAATGKINHATFDVVAETPKAVASDPIRKTGFDPAKAVSAPVKPAAPAIAPVRPVEILEKPKPVYTAEARSQKIEGDVLLDVIFAASGEVRVLGVVRGLGHGLDENAIDAARRIRFAPALQSGRPVDQHVTLHVVFQITG